VEWKVSLVDDILAAAVFSEFNSFSLVSCSCFIHETENL